MSSDPRRGDLAICALGHVGVIACAKPQPVTYPDGNEGMAWVGWHIHSSLQGTQWSSRNPIVIARAQLDGTFEPDDRRRSEKENEMGDQSEH